MRVNIAHLVIQQIVALYGSYQIGLHYRGQPFSELVGPWCLFIAAILVGGLPIKGRGTDTNG